MHSATGLFLVLWMLGCSSSLGLLRTVSRVELGLRWQRCSRIISPVSTRFELRGIASTSKPGEPTLALEEVRQVRLQKLAALRSRDMNPFAYHFPVSHKAKELHARFAHLAKGTEDSTEEVAVAGRIMIRRAFGKLQFFELHDESGSIQLYIDKARLGEDFAKLRDLTDAGDIIGVTGTLKRTDKGELSIYVRSWSMLTKSLLPLPDKFHGLTDVNKRYRLRHWDMIANPSVRQTLRSRAKIISSLRSMLDQQDFLEIETPILQSQPGGAEARPFETFHHALDMPLTLRIATELHLKRMIVGGFDRVYEIGRIFRNEGLSTRHNPEFTSIELYQAYADYTHMMHLCEHLLSHIALQVTGGQVVQYQGQSLDLRPPWRRVSMHALVQETTGVDFYPFVLHSDAEAAAHAAHALGIPLALLHPSTGPLTAGEVLNVVFEQCCERNLIQPTFVTEHPVDISPLAKPHRTLAGLTERFELFIAGREHANGFSELTDPIDQRARFMRQAEKKARGDVEACEVDEDFLHALEVGLPPTAGQGIGIDRVVMLLTDSAAIRDVIAFPLLRKEAAV